MVARDIGGIGQVRERFGILDAAKSGPRCARSSTAPPPAHAPPVVPRRPRGACGFGSRVSFGNRGAGAVGCGRHHGLGGLENRFWRRLRLAKCGRKEKACAPAQERAVMDFATPRITLNYVNGAIMPETLAGH